MRYRRLGKWGVKVSEITLGTWLTHGGRSGTGTAIECTRRAYDLGVNLFDTANEYQAGEAERMLGKALSCFPRETYLVATKVFSPMGQGPLERGLSRKHVLGQADASLRRLGLDHIDLYQCHRFDSEVPLEETAAVMNDLIRWGKVLYWGVSEWSASQLQDILSLCRTRGWSAPVCSQTHYSGLWREHEREVLPACRSLGMGVLAFAPLAHGVLTGKYPPGVEPPEGSRRAGEDRWIFDRYSEHVLLEAVQKFRALAEEHGLTAAQLALGWCLRNPAVTGVLIGASRLGQLEENVAAAELHIAPELIERGDQILRNVSRF
ncbi:aldo/keto reductase family protein [Saccharomonospora sp. NPDC006951]